MVRLGRSAEVYRWAMQVSEIRVQIMAQCQALRKPLEVPRSQLLLWICREYSLYGSLAEAIDASRDTWKEVS
jgi:hypothetical protein